MASARQRRRDKQLETLVEQNVQLRDDVEALETAYYLHRQLQTEEQQSLPAVLRREIGGSIWQHGGTGKLQTYKCSKDLEESSQHHVGDQPAAERKKTSSVSGKQAANDSKYRTKTKDVASQDSPPDPTEGKIGEECSDRVSLLKTKVLKKAGAKVIKRDTWLVPSQNVEPRHEDVGESKRARVDKPNPRLSAGKTFTLNGIGKAGGVGEENSKSKIVKRNKPKGDVSSQVKSTSQTSSKKGSNKGENARTGNKAVKTVGEGKLTGSKLGSPRQSRRDVYDKKKVENTNKCFGSKNMATSKPKPATVDATNVLVNVINDDSNATVLVPNKLQDSAPSLPSKLRDEGSESSLLSEVRDVGNLKKKRLGGETATEIFLDPETFQVRVKSGQVTESLSSLTGTKVLIQPGGMQCDDGSDTLTCSVLERDKVQENSQKEFKDIFGLEDLEKSKLTDPVFKDISSRLVRNNLSHVGSSAGTVVSCDREVEGWLRTLALPDVNRYVAIFAEHQVTMNVVESMTAVQLHEIGVLAFGALNKILRGIKDLKNNSQVKKSKNSKESANIKEKEHRKPSKKLPTDDDKSKQRLRNGTFITEEQIDVHDERSPSSESDTSNEQFSSSHSNNSAIKTKDGNRPHSALPKPGKSVNSVNSNRPSSAQVRPVARAVNVKSETRTPNSKAVNKNNSNLGANKKKAEMPEYKRRGVLLQHRSSSLSREGRRLQSRKTKPAEAEDDQPSRGRSRSADAVRRKALAGVHAAAKRFEEKRQLLEQGQLRGQHTVTGRKRLTRDEMAARHLLREKQREEAEAEERHLAERDMSISVGDQEAEGLENLVSVNILTRPESREGSEFAPPSGFGKTRKVESKSPVSPSSRRSGQGGWQSEDGALSSPIREAGRPLLSTYKISSTRNRLTTEPVQASNSTGAQSVGGSVSDGDHAARNQSVQDKVTDIQSKIKRLKSKATSGDEVTLTLVRDLQTQLSEFEKQLQDKDISGFIEPASHSPSLRAKHKVTLPKPLPQKSKAEGQDQSERRSSAIEALLEEDEIVKLETLKVEQSSAAMSKKELLEEMRKEKHQHHRQIRQLQTELKRIRHADPVWNLELDPSHIVYRERDLVGEGGFSQVFRGIYQGSEVAIKRLKAPLLSQDRNYFAAEVSLLRELRHPRVVLLIGVCTSERLPLMLLEYMSGGCLFSHLHNRKGETLDHAEYYQIARDVSLGMTYLHRHKPQVLHLDLKSKNVLLCHNFRAKIADFGFSKLRLEADEKSSQKLKSRQSRGSPAWMAPELLDKGEITGKADVFSFGIILWEMITQHIPYENCSIFQILEMVRKNKRPEIPSTCPKGLEELVRKCWDPNQAKRPNFQDIVAMLESLAFPPAWRELFKEAGVPDEALHNVESTRTIISLVTSTLDSSLLSSFMLQSKSTSNTEEPRPREVTTATEEDVSTTRSDFTMVDDEDEQSDDISSGSGSDIDSESEDSLVEESSTLSSEDSLETLATASRDRNPVKTTSDTHTFVPALHLSTNSDLLSDSGGKDGEADWFSISLDDRTYRKSPEQTVAQSDTRLPLLQGLGSPSPRAAVPKAWCAELDVSDPLSSNRSASSKTKQQKGDNGIQVSPKKRASLSRKLADRVSLKSSDLEAVASWGTEDREAHSNCQQGGRPAPGQPFSCSSTLENKVFTTAKLDSSTHGIPRTLSMDKAGTKALDIRDNSVAKLDHRSQTSEEEITPRNTSINSPKYVPSSDEFETVETPRKNIRVILVPKEKVDSKKPVITPRRSKMKSCHPEISDSTNKKPASETRQPDIEECISTNGTKRTDATQKMQPMTGSGQVDSAALSPVAPLAPPTLTAVPPTSLAPPPSPPPPPPPPICAEPQAAAVIRAPGSEASGQSMAVELKLKLAMRESSVQLQAADSKYKDHGRPRFSQAVHTEDTQFELAPQPSTGMPFLVQSLQLQEQKEVLRSTSKPHPNQLEDLTQVSKEQLSSIAEILKKAVLNRRLAMGEECGSVSQSVDSVSWSVETG